MCRVTGVGFSFPTPCVDFHGLTSACLTLQGECRVRSLVCFFFFLLSILTQTYQHLMHSYHCCPFIIAETKCLNAERIRQVQKGFTTPLFWNCLWQILWKILPANKSLSFEGKFDIWKLSRDSTNKEPRLKWKVWVVRPGPRQSGTASPVGLSSREGRRQDRAHQSRRLCHLYLRVFFPLC